MMTAITFAIWVLVPYSYVPAMDGYADPTATSATADTDFTVSLKSLDKDTYQDTATQQTSQQPSTSLTIVVCSAHGGLGSGSTVSIAGGYNSGLYTASHTIHAMWLSSNIQYYDTIDYYKSVDNNSEILIRDPDCHFEQAVRINNPAYIPPGCGGDGQD